MVYWYSYDVSNSHDIDTHGDGMVDCIDGCPSDPLNDEDGDDVCGDDDHCPDTPKVLFLCTGNSCRSQMAEAILRHLSGDRFEALSAGSNPSGFIHPLAIQTLQRLHVPLENQTSKSWNEFAHEPVDVVITLCDQAAEKTCPIWKGVPICAHWPLPDPSFHPGSEEDRIEFTVRIARRLTIKIRGLMGLDFSAGTEQIQKRITFLGEI